MKKCAWSILAIPALAAAAAAAVFAARAWNNGRDIPVLMYHNVLDGGNLSVWQVSTEEFARQMDELSAAGYRTILPNDIWRASRGYRLLPRKPVVVTFDDGYEGVVRNAEPILAKHGFRAICYLIAGRIAGEGADRGSFDSGPLLSSNEVAAAAARGTIVFGSHSMTHIPNPRHLAAEIPESRHVVRRMSGVKTRDYCYPHGLHGYDFMDEALRRGKYRTALICDDRMFRLTPEADLFAIPRVSAYGGVHNFRITSFSFGGGRASATVANSAVAMPVRCMIRDKASGRTWLSDGDPVRIGQSNRNAVLSATFAWHGLPSDLDPSNVEAIVSEQNGLFTYGAAVRP